MKTLKVRAVQGVRVMLAGSVVGHDQIARFVGYCWKDGDWCVMDEDIVLPFSHEYAAAVKDGALSPVDQETTEACGLMWRQAPASKDAVARSK